ncbi:IS4 family transposase [Acerihabitans arboris]|uniref:IS4 family transposase n=1 Tax=Acerihabitans arboris TaxID=2691583 RepID=A0A845STM3_9GAMM|nr:IS4 family transposase [Acerihabitans arboris]NDL66088.1 IS4 family transposase [Acerihabitans arboris]
MVNQEQASLSWLDEEINSSVFSDRRHASRFKSLMQKLWRGMGNSLPFSCQDRAATKAAYRFLSSDRIDEQHLLLGHSEATCQRIHALEDENILLLQDTTTFGYHRDNPDAVGFAGSHIAGLVKTGNDTGINCGILMHSSLAVTTSGLPLGLTAVKFWTRKKFKGTNALKRKINPTRVPIEEKESYRWLENLRQSTALLQCPERCVHIGDRESDIYELYCLASELNTHFLVRTCVNRLAENTTMEEEMKNVPSDHRGHHRILLRNDKESAREIILSIRWKTLTLHPPIGKAKQYPDLQLTAIIATEEGPKNNNARVEWKLLTDLPVTSLVEATEKLEWYSHRWKIETFHKVMKSGCQAERSRLGSAERLTNLLCCYCILSWRIFWLTMLSREMPAAPAELAFSETEIKILDTMVKDTTQVMSSYTLEKYTIKLAQLGGYMGNKNKHPPGNIVIWRGLRRLNEIQTGWEMVTGRCG